MEYGNLQRLRGLGAADTLEEESDPDFFETAASNAQDPGVLVATVAPIAAGAETLPSGGIGKLLVPGGLAALALTSFLPLPLRIAAGWYAWKTWKGE